MEKSAGQGLSPVVLAMTTPLGVVVVDVVLGAVAAVVFRVRLYVM